jgi:hypothetical protein
MVVELWTHGESDVEEIINHDAFLVLPSIIKQISHSKNRLIEDKLVVFLMIGIL